MFSQIETFDKLDREMQVVALNNYAMQLKMDEVLRMLIEKYKGEKK